jgi:murein tripeptide amidase MpaA
MVDIQFDRYYRYEDLTRLLFAYVEAYPHLVTVDSIGVSYEGRDIWLATVTAHSSGPAADKPALWADGNIHATELSASTTCLYLLNLLVTQYGGEGEQAAAITDLLDTRAFYICPRLNPDGAELALADKPRFIRSSTRPYPYDETPIGGLYSEDVDGDGRMLMMRIADPNGEWKPHPDEPRLMVRRNPTETGGTYYRVVPEGRIENYDGSTFSARRVKEGLDLNRNFPSEWRNEAQQRGAGEYPMSEPEARAAVDFITKHPNIGSALSFHTWSGVLLRPFGNKADDQMPAEDLWTYQKIGEQGKAMTGYPPVSNYHEFRYHPREVITGTFDDWAYEAQGLFGWTIEIWSPQRQAGITDYKYIEWYREHPAEDDLKMLKWSDEKLGGKGYVAWYPFQHPELGAVELGGWDMFNSWRNPPSQFLEAEVKPLAEWAVWHLQIAPRLALHTREVTALGDGHYHVRVVVQNSGWLPAYVTKRAIERKTTRGLVGEISVPQGAKLVQGQPRIELGQLEGRAYTSSAATPWGISTGTPDRAKAEWVIHAPQGGTAEVVMRHDRAGVVRITIPLA